MARALRAVDALGVRILLDDFGKGFSSLSHIADHPLGGLKIDRSFVWSAFAEGGRTDMLEGIVDRFRTLPMSRSAFLVGHIFAELAGMLLAITVLSLSGFAVGWTISSSFGEAAAGYALLIVFAFTMIWIGTLLGVMVRSPDAVMGVGFIVVFPLTFVASTFVPIDGLPDGLRQLAEWNPISSLAAATRTLFGNPTAIPADAAWPLQHPVLASVIWCAVLLAVVIPVTIRAYRHRTTG